MKYILIVGSVLILLGLGWWYWQYRSEILWVSPVPDEIAQLPLTTLQQRLQICGWIPWWDEVAGVSSAQLAGNQLQVVSPGWFGLDVAGRLVKRSGIKEEELLALAKQHRWQILPTISNEAEQKFDAERVSGLLADEQFQQEFIEQVLVFSNKYDGWDLDWEEIKAADAVSYVNLIKRLAEALHEQGKLLSVTVHARTGGFGDWIGSHGHDWQRLGEVADFVRVMGYDYHFSGSPPGPVSPLSWLNTVLQYAVKTVPIEKLVIGLPTYGYDWDKDKGEGVTYNETERRLRVYGGTTKRDGVSGALLGRYKLEGEEHEVWYEDAESLLVKEQLVYAYGINRVCLWRLGGEDEGIWGKD